MTVQQSLAWKQYVGRENYSARSRAMQDGGILGWPELNGSPRTHSPRAPRGRGPPEDNGVFPIASPGNRHRIHMSTTRSTFRGEPLPPLLASPRRYKGSSTPTPSPRRADSERLPEQTPKLNENSPERKIIQLQQELQEERKSRERVEHRIQHLQELIDSHFGQTPSGGPAMEQVSSPSLLPSALPRRPTQSLLQ